MTDLQDKKKGCMYGLAIGDALGAAVEFRDPGTFPPVTGYRGGGPHGIEAGAWTDDTSMALALADSIAHGWDVKDQLTRYAAWYEQGKYSVNDWCFDVGGTTRDAINEFLESGRTVADHHEWSSGNGSIMRLAPVAIKYHGDPMLAAMAAESSATTHSSDMCLYACQFLAYFLSRLMESDGGDREDILESVDRRSASPVRSHAIESWRDNPNIKGSGFVVQSLEASLWAFMTSSSFEEAVLKAVNLGDDADTTGAVTGQMAGAYWGFSGIPKHLVDGLVKKEMIDLYLNPLLG